MFLVHMTARMTSEISLENSKYGSLLKFSVHEITNSNSKIFCRCPIAKQTDLRSLQVQYPLGQRLQLSGRLQWQNKDNVEMFVGTLESLDELKNI